jgi:homoserine dehydrogenase
MIKVGILGLGTVGGGVVKILQERSADFEALLGEPLVITCVMSRRSHRLEELGLSKEIYTDSFETFQKSNPDIVVEVMGGDAPAETILKALESGKKVVTANKALLANRARDFMGHSKGEFLFYEASCCGGIPIISAYEDGLTANRIDRLLGIFNGTCNYILSEMTQKGSDFAEVLAEAQRLGYAEADPTFDVEGIDATHKLCLLGSLSFQGSVPFDAIPSQGITRLSPDDFKWASQNGYTIKLISIGEREGEGIFAGTFPCMIPSGHPMAHVGGAYNAVYIEGDQVGELMFYGAGAGERPTASAVVSDLVAAAQSRARVLSKKVFSEGKSLSVHSDRDLQFFIRLKTPDEVGVLSRLCDGFGQQGISLRSVDQAPPFDGQAEIVFITHPTTGGNLEKALDSLQSDGLILGDVFSMRILDL